MNFCGVNVEADVLLALSSYKYHLCTFLSQRKNEYHTQHAQIHNFPWKTLIYLIQCIDI